MTATTPRFRTCIGSRLPGGATWSAEGTNFSVCSHVARNIELQLYESAESTEPFQRIILDSDTQRTFLRGIVTDTRYTWNDAAFRPKPLDGVVIYEVHVGGYTPHPDYCD